MPKESPNGSPHSAARRLLLSVLEDRVTPVTLTGLTTTNQLVTFDSATPGTVTATVPVTGLTAGDTLVGIDYRPANGQLFGVGAGSQVYRIDPATGAATAVGTPFAAALGGAVGFDFNPAVDKIRIVTSTGQSLRVNADTGALLGTDTPLDYDDASYDAAVGGAAPAPQVSAAAYTLNRSPANAIVTTLYNLDAGTDLLVTQGGPESDPNPNLGQLFVVGPVGFDVTPDSGFDIETGSDMAYATRFTGTDTQVYSLSLTTATSTALGVVAGQNLRGLAIAPPVTGAGAFALAAPTLSFPANRGPLLVTITRTGGTTGAATVNYATSDIGGATGAVAGVDYFPASGTVSFAAGQTTQVIPLVLPAGVIPAAAAKQFLITLSAPSAGVTLGTPAQATVTIPEVPAGTVTTGRTVAAAAGAGGSQVVVFDAVSGAELYRFNAFEASFTGGVTVATDDVTGDGIDDIIVGAGVGGSPRVTVFDGSVTGRSATNRGAAFADFFAYEESARSGVIVAAGDVTGDGIADVVAGTGQGGGPRVRAFDGTLLSTFSSAQLATSFADFFAFEDGARGGVNVAVGEFTGDGREDIVVGSGNGGGPRVRLFDATTLPAGGSPASVFDYFAYAPDFRGGVFVATGDVNGDGFVDLVTGTGPGGGPDVRAFNRGREANPIAGFFAFPEASRGGVRVATNDFNADGTDDIVAASGPGGTGVVRAFNVAGQQQRELTAFSNFAGGVFVG